MKVYLNSSYCALFVLIVITFQQSETARQTRLVKTIDDLDFEMRKKIFKDMKKYESLDRPLLE